jgi:cardiolipin synthase
MNLSLHRIEGNAEWVSVPSAQRNPWQKLAAATAGIVTIGNFVSVIGLASVPYGLLLVVQDHHFLLGFAVLVLGRLCDLLDGWLADKTATKSPLGEKIDATFDKISLGLVLIILAVKNIVPWWALVGLALPHVLVGIMAVIALRRGQTIHPSRAGKFGMAVAWFTLAGFVFIHFYTGGLLAIAQVITAFLFGVSVGLGVASTVGYIKEFRKIL